VGFVAWGALSAALAQNRWVALDSWGIGLSSLVLFLSAREIAPTLRWPVLSGLLAAAVAGAALGLAQAYGADWVWMSDTRSPGGTFGNRNFLAHVSVLAIPPLSIIVLRTRRLRLLLPALLGLGALAAIVVLTRSRAAWLGGVGALMAGAVVMFTLRRSLNLPGGRTAGLAVVVTIAVAVAVLLPNRLRWTSDAPYAETLSRLAEYGEGSGRGRLIQYRNSLDLVQEAPLLGVGAGNWFVHYPKVTREGDPSFAAHLRIPTNPWPSSDWVAFLTERGAIGALLLLMAGAMACGRALAAGRGGTPEDAQAATALVGLLVAALVAGSFDAVLLLAAPSYLVWSAAGLLLPDPQASPRWTPGPTAHALLRAVALVLVLGLATQAVGRSLAVVVAGDGEDQAALARAARLIPGEYRLRILLAEQGDCAAARRAAELLPHHDAVAKMDRACGK